MGCTWMETNLAAQPAVNLYQHESMDIPNIERTKDTPSMAMAWTFYIGRFQAQLDYIFSSYTSN